MVINLSDQGVGSVGLCSKNRVLCFRASPVKQGYHMMLKIMLGWSYAGLKWHFHPTPHRPVPIKKHSYTFIFGRNVRLIIQLNIWWASERSEIMRHWKAYYMSFSNDPANWQHQKRTGYEFKVSSFQTSTSYIPERVASKIRIHFSQFTETMALCCKNISIMPALLMLKV